MRHPTHRERPAQVQDWHRFVQAQHHLGSSGRVGLWLPGSRVLARVRSVSLSALRSMVRLFSKSAVLNVVARELALDALLGLCSVGLATPWAFPTDRLMICPEFGPLSRTFHLSLLSACHGSRLQISIVGSGRPPLRSTGAEHWPGHWNIACFTRRLPCRGPARSLFNRVQAGHPDPLSTQAHVGAPPARAAWKVPPLSEGFASPTHASRPCPPAHAALVPARADGTAVIAQGADDRRFGIASDPQALSSAVRELEGRVCAESNRGSHK